MGVSEARRQPVDAVIADLAARQHGVVALSQLEDAGLSVRAVQKRVARGRLHRVYEGVYAVGHPLIGRDGAFMAAVIACGSGALLSHCSAADLWGLRQSGNNAVDVTAPNRRGRIPAQINAHRDGSLAAGDRTVRCGIPCTTVSRTLLDLAGVLSPWELRKAVSEAEVLRILDIAEARALVRRCRGRRGVARLRLCIDEISPVTRKTRSELERSFLRRCERNGLPRPEVNAPLDVGGIKLRPDFLWRDARVILEADSRKYHGTGSAFELDRQREQRFFAAGWHVVRCTWRQVELEPQTLLTSLRKGLKLPPMGLG
jgi:very-short-patch-repair endonuclease